MRYIQGETLQQRLDRLRRSGKCLSLDESLFIGTQLCSILAYLHGQTPPVIHRDLKPANVILGPGPRIYLIDFSIARRFTQSAAHLLVTPNLRQARGLRHHLQRRFAWLRATGAIRGNRVHFSTG